MKKIAALMLVSLLCACVRQHQDTPEETKAKLKAAMQDFLYKGVNYDSSRVQFHVMEVIYYETQPFYECEFKVHLHNPNTDTTGIMSARISKDFKEVARKS